MKLRLYLLSVWNIIDPIYYSFTRLTYLDRLHNNIFRVRLTRYKGRDVTLTDGTQIRKNDVLVKIHLYNVQLMRDLLPIASDVKRARLIYRFVERSLPSLAAYIQKHPEREQIKGIIGITTLNRGCAQLGFETFAIGSYLYKWLKWLTLVPICLISVSDPWAMLKKHRPKYLFMSKDSLMQKYCEPTVRGRK